MNSLARLLPLCTFPEPTRPVAAAFSGGPDSTALIALARHAGLDVVAHHVDHGIRAGSSADAERARRIGDALDVEVVVHRTVVEPGPNLEARARAARRSLLPDDAMTGHTLDDQAETLLIRLVRGSGATGLAAMQPGPRHPILGLRRSDTETLCTELGLEPARDETNDDPAMWRNRIRHEVLPLLADVAGRDVAPILSRTSGFLRDDDRLLDELAAAIDPTDARAVAAADPALARRALRRWLTEDGYPPDAAAIERVLDVAHGRAVACELPGGRRVERSQQAFRIVRPER